MKAFLGRIYYILLILAVVIVLGTFGFMYLQNLSLLDAFYFTIVTVATVGYGDIVPVGVGGRILAIVIILTGAASFTGLVVNAVQFLSERRTEKLRQERLNMLSELFFSEMGIEMLRTFSLADPGFDKVRDQMIINPAHPEIGLAQFRKQLTDHVYAIDSARLNLPQLKDLLEKNGNLLIRLLENPNLMEHGAFTEILRATFHLRQELSARKDLTNLPASDIEHLANDARRAYGSAAKEWPNHAFYLMKYYPYLFSIALRTNPFRPEAFPVVK